MSYLRDVPFLGVGFVNGEAARYGYVPGDPTWINLGQGQPEIGPLPGAPPRISQIALEPGDHAYGPVNGLPELRHAVADYYNRTYRTGRVSRYTADNVAIVQGGRIALGRVLAVLGDVRIGYAVPDYPAYEELLGTHLSRFTTVAVHTDAADGFRLRPSALRGLGLGALLLSNPGNPTGAIAPLPELLATARAEGCVVILDEFYSHYTYDGGGPVSAAGHVDDVDTDDVVIVDGLTKNHRYPGWRIGWIVGPRHLIDVVERVGGVFDGGASRPAQRAALAALEPGRVAAETTAVRAAFGAKRDLMVAALREMGVGVPHPPEGTFYVWGCLDGLPGPLTDAMEFFTRALNVRVLTVPGNLFDLHPGRHRDSGQLRRWMRFSFGPPPDQIAEGLSRLAGMVRTG